jgi:hypothetical protein
MNRYHPGSCGSVTLTGGHGVRGGGIGAAELDSKESIGDTLWRGPDTTLG